MTPKEKKEDLARQTIAKLSSANNFDKEKRSDALGDLPPKERRAYKKELKEAKATVKEAEATIGQTAEEELLKAQTAQEVADLYQATNDPKEEDAMPSNDNNTTTNNTPAPDTTPPDAPTPPDKNTEKLSDTEIRLALLEAQIKEIKSQLRPIGRHTDTRKLMKTVREMLTEAKKQQIDVNQRYEKAPRKGRFAMDLRNPQDITLMLADIEGKIALAKNIASAALTGQLIPGSQQGQQGEAGGQSMSKLSERNNLIGKGRYDMINKIPNAPFLTKDGNRIAKGIMKSAIPITQGILLFMSAKRGRNLLKAAFSGDSKAIFEATEKLARTGIPLFALTYVDPQKARQEIKGVRDYVWDGKKASSGSGSELGSAMSVDEYATAIQSPDTPAIENKTRNYPLLVGGALSAFTYGDINGTSSYSNGQAIVSGYKNGIPTDINFQAAKNTLQKKHREEGSMNNKHYTETMTALTTLEGLTKDKKVPNRQEIIYEGLNMLGMNKDRLEDPANQSRQFVLDFMLTAKSLEVSVDYGEVVAFKERLLKNNSIAEYFTGHDAELNKFVNQIMELPDATRNEILNGNIMLDVQIEGGNKRFVVQIGGINFYMNLFDAVQTDNGDHKNQLCMKNREGSIQPYGVRFGSYKNMIQGAYCIHQVMKRRGTADKIGILEEGGGIIGYLNNDLMMDGAFVMKKSDLPTEMQGADMKHLNNYLNDKMGDRIRGREDDILNIETKLTQMRFEPIDMAEKIASIINTFTLKNITGANIDVNYAMGPDGHKVLFINGCAREDNSCFLDISTPNPNSNEHIIRVGSIYATTPGHLWPYTFTEGVKDMNGGSGAAIATAVLFSQCTQLAEQNKGGDIHPWHRGMGNKLEFSYGGMGKVAWDASMGLPEDTFSKLFDRTANDATIKAWIPGISDPTIFASAGDENRTSLTEFLNGFKRKDSAGNTTSESFWHEDEKKRASAFVSQMEKAAERIGIQMRPLNAPKPEDMKTLNDLAPYGIEPGTAYIIPLNKTDYAGLETFRMIKFDANEDGSCILHEVYFQPADKQIGGLGVPVPTDMKKFLEINEGYLDVKGSGVANAVYTIAEDGKNTIVRLYKDAKSVLGTGYEDVSSIVGVLHTDLEQATGITYEDAKRGISVLYTDLVKTGIPLVYDSTAQILHDSVDTIMRAWEKVGGTIKDPTTGKEQLKAIHTLNDFNNRVIEHTDIDLEGVVKKIVGNIHDVYGQVVEKDIPAARQVVEKLIAGIFYVIPKGIYEHLKKFEFPSLPSRLSGAGDVVEYDNATEILQFLAEFDKRINGTQDTYYGTNGLNSTKALTNFHDSMQSIMNTNTSIIKSISFDKTKDIITIMYYSNEDPATHLADPTTEKKHTLTLTSGGTINYPELDGKTPRTIITSGDKKLGNAIKPTPLATEEVLITGKSDLENIKNNGDRNSIRNKVDTSNINKLDRLIADIDQGINNKSITSVSYNNKTKVLTIKNSTDTDYMTMDDGETMDSKVLGQSYDFI